MSGLVLASASPRRQALVGLLQVPWRVAPAQVDETQFVVGEPLVAALRVAVAKADATLAGDAETVLAADTLVVSGERILAKPIDIDDAWSMLRGLRGQAHQVMTGIALRGTSGAIWGGVVSTDVWIRDYADAEIADYIARGEPFDKAGGYAIQDEVFHPVERLAGCYLNVVGLPLCAVAAGLTALGTDIGRAGPPPCGYCRAGAPLVSIRSAY